MKNINQVLSDIPIPKMVKVRQHFNAPELVNTKKTVQQTLKNSGVLARVNRGDTVAITVGSRGIADIPIITKEVINAVKHAGGYPFIVPAMGSHGGATAEGQKQVLRNLGITEDTLGAPIRSSMDVVRLGELSNGLPIYIDKQAYEANKIILINRIKPHTAFDGPYESGLMKMITIGLGKRKGADAAHQYGFGHMAEHIPKMAHIVLSKVPIIFGLATIENAYDRPATIVAIPAEEIADKEQILLQKAKSLMPRLLLNKLDVLVVDEIGKDISGSGMDPNITGRFPTPFKKNIHGTDIKRIVILGLTDRTSGNANGVGFGDITTEHVFNEVALEKGYFNALTSTVVDAVKIPMFLRSKELAVKAGIKTSNAPSLNKVRLTRIKNTLEIKDIWISESMLEEARLREDIEILSSAPAVMNFS